MDCSCVLVSGMKSKPRLVTSAIIQAEPSFKANCILLNRAGSIPLRNWNLLPIQNQELELNCHHWNKN